MALLEDTIDIPRFCGRLAEWTRVFDPTLATAIVSQLPDWISLEPVKAVGHISRVGESSDIVVPRWEGISPFVTPSVLWSLYSFLRTPEDYWETMCTAISVGGDVDTTAAMAGAMSGARVGIEGLPDNWVRRVTDRGEWGYEDLVTLAMQCYQTNISCDPL
jgi:hypothetical protein